MTDLNARTFDLGAVLQGRSYPEIEVPFYIDEKTAFALNRAEKELTHLALLNRIEEHDELEKKVEELKASLRSQRYTYHLRGVPNKVRQDALKKAVEKYPRAHDILGREEENEDRDLLFTDLLWHALTVKIVAPDGAVQVPTVENIVQFREYAPRTALDAINEGIAELSTGVKAGFEAAAQETDFLSRP